MNKKKQMLINLANSYFITVTFINLVIYLLGSIFRPEQRFGYSAFLSPLIYGLVAFIPLAVSALLSSGKELTCRQLVFRKIAELAAIEAVLLFFGFGTENLTSNNKLLIVCFALSVFYIYAMVTLISWRLDVRTARRINVDLQAFQARHSEQ